MDKKVDEQYRRTDADDCEYLYGGEVILEFAIYARGEAVDESRDCELHDVQLYLPTTQSKSVRIWQSWRNFCFK